jgi:NADH:ubiquinone oxidoreductase subunit 3 (subunit A)
MYQFFGGLRERISARVIYLALIIAFGVVSLGMAMILRPARPYASKLDNYECGAEPIGQAWVQFPVGFYLVALIFIVFDALAVFLFPWALMLKRPGHGRRGGHGALPRYSSAGLAVRASARDPGVEVKAPVPQIPPRCGRSSRISRSGRSIHKQRPAGDKHSALFETVDRRGLQFPGGFVVTTLADAS